MEGKRMLALSRKKNEAIIINNNIEITVLDIRGDQIKLGISAPKEIPIYRKEVYIQIQNENKEALAMMLLSVVLPSPGGPCSRVWSSDSPRWRAA